MSSSTKNKSQPVGHDDQWFQQAKDTLNPGGRGVAAITPATSVRCTVCGQTVRARPQQATSASVRYVLPVDDQGRCPACAWDGQ